MTSDSKTILTSNGAKYIVEETVRADGYKDVKIMRNFSNIPVSLGGQMVLPGTGGINEERMKRDHEELFEKQKYEIDQTAKNMKE